MLTQKVGGDNGGGQGSAAAGGGLIVLVSARSRSLEDGGALERDSQPIGGKSLLGMSLSSVSGGPGR